MRHYLYQQRVSKRSISLMRDKLVRYKILTHTSAILIKLVKNRRLAHACRGLAQEEDGSSSKSLIRLEIYGGWAHQGLK